MLLDKLFIIILLFTPIYIYLLPSIAASYYNTAVYFSILPLAFKSFQKINKSWFIYKPNDFKSFLLINFYMISTGVIYVFFGQYNLDIFLKTIIPFITSIIMIYYFSTFSRDRYEKIILTIINIILISFFVQLILSIYESVLGYYISGTFAQFDSNVDKRVLEYTNNISISQRNLLSVFGFNLFDLFSLKLPFSGFIGQHNYWGTQLPFYNLIMIYAYKKYDKKYYKYFLFIIFFAALLNTSRFGIFAILITNMIYFRKIRVYGYIILTLLFFTVLDKFYDYFNQTNTLIGRIDSYSQFLDYFSSFNLFQYFFGIGPEKTSLVTYTVMLSLHSLESQFFYFLFYGGLIGILIFIYYLFSIAFIKNNKNFIILSFNILIVSLISNLVFTVFIYQFVTFVFIIYIYETKHRSQYTTSF